MGYFTVNLALTITAIAAPGYRQPGPGARGAQLNLETALDRQQTPRKPHKYCLSRFNHACLLEHSAMRPIARTRRAMPRGSALWAQACSVRAVRGHAGAARPPRSPLPDADRLQQAQPPRCVTFVITSAVGPCLIGARRTLQLSHFVTEAVALSAGERRRHASAIR